MSFRRNPAEPVRVNGGVSAAAEHVRAYVRVAAVAEHVRAYGGVSGCRGFCRRGLM